MTENYGDQPRIAFASIFDNYSPLRSFNDSVSSIPQDHQAQPRENSSGQQPVITNQPRWMSSPPEIINCPSGLEYLAYIDKLSVYEQFKEQSIIFTRNNNKFTIQNGLGELVYMALEDAGCCTRDCECCTFCPFGMIIADSSENEIIRINRPMRFDMCCCPCFLNEIEVTLPSDSVIGTVKQNWSLIYPDFSINNAAGETILKIKGPCMKTGYIKFDIKSNDGIQTIGSIINLPPGEGRSFTLGDGLGLTFPIDLDVQIKAVCLGALFLIKTMYFDLKRLTKLNRHRGLL